MLLLPHNTIHPSLPLTYKQLLLVQDGKFHGRDPFFAVITRAAALPEAAKSHDVQRNGIIVHLGQVRAGIILGIIFSVYSRSPFGKE